MEQTLVSNVLIAGKSGVGKSAFLNYIYGAPVAESRAGTPVTAEGLHEYTLRDADSGVLFRFFDTWGLEADRTEAWHEVVLSVVRRREGALSVGEWFHTIYYLLSINSGRVEHYEIETVLRPLVRQRSNVMIVLTNYNPYSASNVEKAEAMERVLVRELGMPRAQIIRVNSVEKKLLNGQTVPTLGYEDIWRQNRRNLWTTIERRLPRNVTDHVLNELAAWEKRSLKSVSRVHVWTPQLVISRRARRIREDLERTLEMATLTVEEALEEAVTLYVRLLKRYPEVREAPSVRRDLPFRFDESAARALRKMVVGIIPGVQLFYWAFKRRQAEREMNRAILEQSAQLRRKIAFELHTELVVGLKRLGEELAKEEHE